MRRFALTLACASLLAGCTPLGSAPIHINEFGENCYGNSPPAVGNVQINSFAPAEGQTTYMSINFEWIDPGVSGASDAPNVWGGNFTTEFSGYVAQDFELDEPLLTSACNVPPPEDPEDPNLCSISGHPMNGCSSTDIESCPGGTLTFIYQAEDGFQDGQVVDIEFRLRDRCEGTSNEKSATYLIGSGLAIEGAGGEDA